MSKEDSNQLKMKTVITYGVFDLFHEGHVNLLRRAKALGDKLIVGVTSNDFARERGKLILADSLDTRMNNVRNCEYVDEVILESHFGQKLEDVQKYQADVFVIGDDWKGKFDYLKSWCDVVYLPRTPGISSSSLRNAPYPEIKFGIIGSGRIARRFMAEAKYVRGGVRIRNIYNPHYDSSLSFSKEYENLYACKEINELYERSDAIYIASPHAFHYQYAKDALMHDKHVLCEKPLTLNSKEAEELFALAKQRNLILMEAIKTAYCPGFIRLLTLVQSGFIGEIHDVEACFTSLKNTQGREWDDKEYGGSFTEYASYTLLPIIKLLGTDDLNIEFKSIFKDGIDYYTVANISNKDIFASSKNGLGVKTAGRLVISGTGGYLEVEAPWWKTSRFTIHHEDPDEIEYYNYDFLGDGLRYEISEFVDRLQGWHTSDYKLSAKESIALASIFEEYLKYRKNILQ